jgi:hypothetical protein
MESDVIYFGRRAGEERRAAMQADHPGVRQAHLEMAQRYDDLVTAIDARDRLLGLEPSGPVMGEGISSTA